MKVKIELFGATRDFSDQNILELSLNNDSTIKDARIEIIKYLEENFDGKIKQPVKGATLIGNGPDVLNRVSMVGNDSAMDTGIGTCGKGGQSVPVGVGQPTMLVNDLTVGGTAR